MPPKPQPETEAPFGAKKRDWTLLWRVVMLIFGGGSTLLLSVIIYAGTSYIKAQAKEAVKEEIRPVNDETLKKFADYVLKASYDGDQRLGATREAEVARRVENVENASRANRDRIEATQREMIDRIHGLELMIREGFAKQGVQLSAPK